MHLREKEKHGDEGGLRRDEEAREHGAERESAPDEPELGEGVAGGEGERDLEERDGGRHEDGDPHVPGDRERREDLAVGARVDVLGERRRGVRDDLGERLERREDHPRVREEPRRGGDAREREDGDVAGAALSHRETPARARHTRSCRPATARSKTKKTTVSALARPTLRLRKICS